MEQKKVKKTIGPLTALCIVVGCIIGTGVFFKPQAIYQTTGGAPGMGILSWVVGGIITLCAGLTVAEISVVIPKTGGMMVYLEEIFGEKIGYLTGWMQSILFYPGMAAAVSVTFGNQLAYLLGRPEWEVGLSVMNIIGIYLINTIGTKTGGYMQNISTIAKLFPLVMIMVFAFVKGDGNNEVMFPLVSEGISPVNVFGSLLVAVLFSYDGWLNVGSIAGEMKNPAKDLPKAIVGGISLVMAVYITLNVAYLWVLPATELAKCSAPAVAVAEIIFGKIGGRFITVGILISAFSCINGYILTGSRVVYRLAMDRTIPGYNMFSKLNNSNLPGNGVAFITFLACLYAFSGKYNLLTDLATFTSWLFYVLTFVAVIILRKTKPDIERIYKVPLYPFVPMVAILGGGYVLFNQMFLAGEQARNIAIFGILITLLGLPIYYIMDAKRRKEDTIGKIKLT